MELGIPVVMAVNMIDIMEKSGDKISIKDLKESLGCEVVEISALKGKGIKEAANKAVELAKNGKLEEREKLFPLEGITADNVAEYKKSIEE